ncbi:hypothetical protein FA13DRAFT_1732085 [Coprinellus micaceus]|uniref:Uncharacterized protein n=1 Tax=Coprinellus micaceus TaxID=71717 RepID=A0A4Y7TCX5_COPMI|nr:hypothetical protein FA13DRAFT_1732085 [Coprinellus micaceus]
MDLIDDTDLAVSDHVVELLNTRYLSASNPVEIFLWTHQGSLERLVRKLVLGEGEYSRSRAREGLIRQDGNTPSRWAVLEEAVKPVIGVYSRTT